MLKLDEKTSTLIHVETGRYGTSFGSYIYQNPQLANYFLVKLESKSSE